MITALTNSIVFTSRSHDTTDDLYLQYDTSEAIYNNEPNFSHSQTEYSEDLYILPDSWTVDLCSLWCSILSETFYTLLACRDINRRAKIINCSLQKWNFCRCNMVKSSSHWSLHLSLRHPIQTPWALKDQYQSWNWFLGLSHYFISLFKLSAHFIAHTNENSML